MKSTKNIAIEKLHPFENHPYKVQDNEEMEALAESIQENGIVSPVIVRPLENTTDEYEIISGHRGVMASKKAAVEEVPAFVVSLDRDAAAIVLVDSNIQREHILPSEKAFAYKMKMEALSHQGKTSDQLGPKLTVEQISKDDSATQVKRYIRLTNLNKQLLDMVDEGKIAFTPAVELSYLNEIEQQDLVEAISECDATPNLSQACRFKKMSAEQGLTPESITEILNEKKANQKPMFKIHYEKLQAVAPKIQENDFEVFVVEACKRYYKYLERQKDRER